MFIGSRKNEKIKNVVKLRNRAAREKSRLFFFEGVHLLEEYLRNGHSPHALFVCEDVMDIYCSLLDSVDHSRIYTVTKEVFLKISTEKAPQGILTVSDYLDGNVVFLKNKDNSFLSENKAKGLLFLESVRDSGNVGTIIRTAAAMGISCILSKDCADIYSSKTLRASMGALFSSKIFIAEDLSDSIKVTRNCGRMVFASALGRKSLTLGEFQLRIGDCFVVGNEGSGISENIINLCDNTVKIPMTNAAESLNASAAAAILLWELRRCCTNSG